MPSSFVASVVTRSASRFLPGLEVSTRESRQTCEFLARTRLARDGDR